MHTCVCLFTLACTKSIIKISHFNRPKSIMKCCWHRMEKNLHKKHIKKLDLSMDLYDRITRTPLQVSVSVLPMVKAETL